MRAGPNESYRGRKSSASVPKYLHGFKEKPLVREYLYSFSLLIENSVGIVTDQFTRQHKTCRRNDVRNHLMTLTPRCMIANRPWADFSRCASNLSRHFDEWDDFLESVRYEYLSAGQTPPNLFSRTLLETILDGRVATNPRLRLQVDSIKTLASADDVAKEIINSVTISPMTVIKAFNLLNYKFVRKRADLWLALCEKYTTQP